MKFTVHAGHAAPGNKFIGAVGYCSESLVDRQITRDLKNELINQGHEVVDCTVDKGISQSNIIYNIKKNINAVSDCTANISIHLNALNAKSKKDNKTTGVECCVYSLKAAGAAGRICSEISQLGFKNRGVKQRTDLGVLKGIKNGGDNILIECFFCNDEDDYNVYRKVGSDNIAKSIAKALISYYMPVKQPEVKIINKETYIYDGIDYKYVFNPNYYAINNSDVKKDSKYGKNNQTLFQHFLIHGMKEGRQACADFNVKVYKERYSDLKAAFGQDLPRYYRHFCTHQHEGRKGI